MERSDDWSRVLASPLLKQQGQIRVPGPIEIPRPGDEPQRKQVETNPAVIAEFFRKHVERR